MPSQTRKIDTSASTPPCGMLPGPTNTCLVVMPVGDSDHIFDMYRACGIETRIDKKKFAELKEGRLGAWRRSRGPTLQCLNKATGASGKGEAEDRIEGGHEARGKDNRQNGNTGTGRAGESEVRLASGVIYETTLNLRTKGCLHELFSNPQSFRP
jgi:hypothetical protein